MRADSKRICPYRGSSEVFRSHRRGAVERCRLRAIQVRPFRCVNCDARFYGRRDSYGPTSQDLEQPNERVLQSPKRKSRSTLVPKAEASFPATSHARCFCMTIRISGFGAQITLAPEFKPAFSCCQRLPPESNFPQSHLWAGSFLLRFHSSYSSFCSYCLCSLTAN